MHHFMYACLHTHTHKNIHTHTHHTYTTHTHTHTHHTYIHTYKTRCKIFFSKVVCMCSMKAYGRLKVCIHSFLSLALGGGEWSTVLLPTSLPRRTLQVDLPTELAAVGRSARSGVENNKVLRFYWELNHNSSVFKPVA
jgi:hypothetical protein